MMLLENSVCVVVFYRLMLFGECLGVCSICSMWLLRLSMLFLLISWVVGVVCIWYLV